MITRYNFLGFYATFISIKNMKHRFNWRKNNAFTMLRHPEFLFYCSGIFVKVCVIYKNYLRFKRKHSIQNAALQTQLLRLMKSCHDNKL